MYAIEKMNRKPNRRLLLEIVIVAVFLVVQCILLSLIANEKKNEKIQAARYYGEDIANTIQLTLDSNLKASETLRYIYMQYGEDCFTDFESIASKIAADNPVIGSMYIAPKAVIQVAYPQEVNESTIGFAMLKDPEQGPRAQLAIDTRKTTVAGPHDLVEGGVGFIIRDPVFDGDEFLGFTILVLDWDRVVDNVLNNIKVPENSYKFAVWKADHDETAVTDSDGYIFRSSDSAVSDLVDIEFEVPNDTWHLVIEPVKGWTVRDEMMLPVIMSLILDTAIAFGIVFMRRINRKDDELKKELAANEAIAAANNAKTTFLFNMSHDIRTPMNAILGFSRLMEKELDNPAVAKDYLSKIQSSGEYLLSIINNVLDMARIESGKVTLDEELMETTAAGTNAVHMIMSEMKKKNLTFTHSEEYNHEYVLADAAKINQIFVNLLSNAVKYTPEGGSIHLDLKEYPCEKEGYGRFVSEVSDSGIGMSEEFQKVIFESFSREKNTTESKIIGTGLGMAIVKKLIDLMDGTIEVESEPGKGSKFTVTLTLKIAEKTSTELEKPEESEVSLEGKRILLAEDNELNAEIAIAILDELNLQVERAEDGVQCIDMLNRAEAGYYDLILMDIQMPNMDGYKATQAIRKLSDPKKANIPILAMTANAFAEDKEKALSVGMNGHLAKPINVAELMKALAGILG